MQHKVLRRLRLLVHPVENDANESVDYRFLEFGLFIFDELNSLRDRDEQRTEGERADVVSGQGRLQ